MLLVSMNVMTSLWRATSRETPSRSTRVPDLPLYLSCCRAAVSEQRLSTAKRCSSSSNEAATSEEYAEEKDAAATAQIDSSFALVRSFARSLVRSLVCTH